MANLKEPKPPKIFVEQGYLSKLNMDYT